MAAIRREHSGVAADTTLTSLLLVGAGSLSINDATGWPTGSVGPFVVTVEQGGASEEKILCSSRAGTTLTVATSGRGYDGTTEVQHLSGVAVTHTFSAIEADEANEHVMDSASHVTSPGALPPTGSVLPYAGTAAPSGWLLADGSAVSRTTYSDLFAVVSTTYGAGDGATTFNVPDLRGRHVLGAGAGTGLTARTRGVQAGSEDAVAVSHSHSHSHTASSGTESANHAHSGTTAVENAAHSHGVPVQQTSGSLNAGGFVGNINGGGNTQSGTESANHAHSFSTSSESAAHAHTVTVNADATAAGVSGADKNMPPFLVLNHIIKH